MSYGSGYGGNALREKVYLPCGLPLVARDNEWMAEHAHSWFGRSPGRKNFVRVPFRSACGKTNMAMLVPPEANERVKVQRLEMILPGLSRTEMASCVQ